MVLSFAAAAPASANAPSIAGAPIVPYGQPQFGNTAGPGTNFGGGCWGEGRVGKFWTLDGLAGDSVTIQWETNAFAVDEMYVFPVGTTDFNVSDADAYRSDEPNDNYKSEAKFTTPVGGSMPLTFTRCADATGGPYSFTAYVAHGVRSLSF